MVDAIDLSKAGELPEQELREELRALASHLCTLEEAHLDAADRDVMVREIMGSFSMFFCPSTLPATTPARSCFNPV